jgi:hypothetical protein
VWACDSIEGEQAEGQQAGGEQRREVTESVRMSVVFPVGLFAVVIELRAAITRSVRVATSADSSSQRYDGACGHLVWTAAPVLRRTSHEGRVGGFWRQRSALAGNAELAKQPSVTSASPSLVGVLARLRRCGLCMVRQG